MGRQGAKNRVDPFRLLNILERSGPLPVAELLGQSGMSFADFVDSLRIVIDAGLVTVDERATADLVGLTANGEQVSRLAS